MELTGLNSCFLTFGSKVRSESDTTTKILMAGLILVDNGTRLFSITVMIAYEGLNMVISVFKLLS